MGHNLHELMPPRLKIVAPRHPLKPEEDPSVYSYTSPLRAEFITRKLLKFTVPVSVLNYQKTANESEMVEDIQKFDDVKIHGNIVLVLIGGSKDKTVESAFEKLSDEYRERFFFFNALNMEGASSVYAIGNNFTRQYQLTNKTHPYEELESIL